MAKLEGTPLHVGNLLRILQDETASPHAHPELKIEKGELRPNITIRDILSQLSISLWPPARPGQCFHPECKQSKAVMTKSTHPTSHQCKRDWIWESREDEKMRGGAYSFDGESCLTATTASLVNAMVVTPQSAKYSDAYKLGKVPEKHISTFHELDTS
jgi:hypothetical protein